MRGRIGFLSYWGFGRGLPMVTLCFAKMIEDDYDVYILKQGTNDVTEEFKSVNVNITENPSYIVEPEIFKKWVLDNKLDAVVFNEFGQWSPEPNNLVALAKKLGVKAYGFLVMERFEREQTIDYDRVFVPTVSFERFMRANGVRNFTYIPYSVDLKEFPLEKPEKNGGFTFFHPGGFGGVYERKNTILVLNAFKSLNDVDAKLLITSQKPLDSMFKSFKNVEVVDKNLSRKDLLKYYRVSDATVLPSKWETIGIPIFESLASGTPVVTSDIPPMNEVIKTGLNGYVCSGELSTYKGIRVNALDVNIIDLKNKMRCIMNKTLHPILCRNSRHVVGELYNLEKNKHYLLNFNDRN